MHGITPGVRQSMLTMIFLTSGRLDLASSFSLFTPEITRDVSRTYPHYREIHSARPLDAFTGVKDPQVYDLELTPDWHQITFYNTGAKHAEISTAISGEAELKPHPAKGLGTLILTTKDNAEVKWSVRYE